MAVGEARKNGTISQVSWTDGVSLDPYYGLEHSFQYASNLNTDDELHGIKLSQKPSKNNSLSGYQLIACGDNGVIGLPREGGSIKKIEYTGSSWNVSNISRPTPDSRHLWDLIPGVIFQDNIWYGVAGEGAAGGLVAGNITGAGGHTLYIPRDHATDTDDDISTESDTPGTPIMQRITAILNYNNTRLVVGAGNELWVYYPELDIGTSTPKGKTGWKKVLEYEAGVTIVALTCTFEYLKVRAVDEGWNTKIYFYQGNNNLKNTFVYNLIDLTGQRVMHAYPINGIDYYTTSTDGTDGYVNLYKLVGTSPVLLIKQRAGLSEYDIYNKAPYFVGPTSMDAAYGLGAYYIADSYGIFKFTPVNSRTDYQDRGYMKWKLSSNNNTHHPYGLCINKNFLYVSTDEGCYAVRIYDTGKGGYQDEGILISREIEGQYGGTITKMLDEIRLGYELNPRTTGNGKIEVFVSPNNLWRSTDFDSTGWYKVMEITQTSAGTRTERTELLNNLNDGNPAFGFDWQTITYGIKISVGSEDEATPTVRQIDINYHTKDKTNNVYNIK